VRPTKPRYKMRIRMSAIKRRRKGVEFIAGAASNSFFYYRKRNLIDPKAKLKEHDISVGS